jgi:hypothetical protein
VTATAVTTAVVASVFLLGEHGFYLRDKLACNCFQSCSVTDDFDTFDKIILADCIDDFLISIVLDTTEDRMFTV